jgi:hypothetical protein
MSEPSLERGPHHWSEPQMPRDPLLKSEPKNAREPAEVSEPYHQREPLAATETLIFAPRDGFLVWLAAGWELIDLAPKHHGQWSVTMMKPETKGTGNDDTD